MTFEQLKEQMKRFNDTYYTRFAISDGEVFIKGYRHPVPFTESDHSKALQLVAEYGMFKPDALCRGKELYYKGLKWSDLSDEQKGSLVAYNVELCNHNFGDGMIPESEYPEAFESNQLFFYYN